MSRYRAHVAHGTCQRCGRPFGFYQVTSAKIYCKSCRAAKHRNSGRFYDSFARYKERNKVAQIVVAF